MTLIAYTKYRKSSEYLEDGFKVPMPNVLVPVTIVAFGLIFISLFFFKDTRIPAIGSAIWIVVFGIISYLRKEKQLTYK